MPAHHPGAGGCVVTAQSLYDAYCRGSECRDALWLAISSEVACTLSHLLHKTGAVVPCQERDDLITDSVLVLMARLDRREPIQRIGGVIYYATSNRLRSRKFRYAKLKEEVLYSQAIGAERHEIETFIKGDCDPDECE